MKTFSTHLNGRVYSCARCNSNIAQQGDVISKRYEGTSGPAYLFHNVVNVECLAPKLAILWSGQHSVSAIKCKVCQTDLGWKYVKVCSPSQKHKEGKYLLEKAYMVKENRWEQSFARSLMAPQPSKPKS